MYKAVRSFSGVISMKKGDVKEIRNREVAEDLLRVGYIESVEGVEKAAEVKRGRRKKEEADNAE